MISFFNVVSGLESCMEISISGKSTRWVASSLADTCSAGIVAANIPAAANPVRVIPNFLLCFFLLTMPIFYKVFDPVFNISGTFHTVYTNC